MRGEGVWLEDLGWDYRGPVETAGFFHITLHLGRQYPTFTLRRNVCVCVRKREGNQPITSRCAAQTSLDTMQSRFFQRWLPLHLCNWQSSESYLAPMEIILSEGPSSLPGKFLHTTLKQRLLRKPQLNHPP